MVTLRLINDFLKDPLTDKLFRKYVTEPKAQQIFDTTVRLIEIAMVAVPLAITASKGLRDMMDRGDDDEERTPRRAPRSRRLQAA
jgi:hypothetical protein